MTNPKDLIGVKKPPLHLVPPALALWVSKVFQQSGIKYGPFNWREKAVKKSIYLDAIERHLLALKDGEWAAVDSGLPHLAHIGANVAILFDADALGNLIDDMEWVDGPAPQIISDLTEDTPPTEPAPPEPPLLYTSGREPTPHVMDLEPGRYNSSGYYCRICGVSGMGHYKVNP